MKLQGKQVRFRITFPWFGRRRLIFTGKRNTIQLLETAMVIEGYLQRFFYFPFVDSFFRMPFSEWTTVTMPYSRIQRCRYAPMLIARILATVIAWLPFLLVGLIVGGSILGGEGQNLVDSIIPLILLGLVGLVITLFVNLYLFVPRYYLWFRQGDGKRAVVVFRIPSNKKRLAFDAQLREYRKATREKGVAMAQVTDAELAAPSPGTWVVLLAFILGHQAVVPFVYRLDSVQARLAGPMGWAMFGLEVLLAVLPPILLSLALVARRNEAIRWSAVFTLAIAGMIPLVRWSMADARQEVGDELIVRNAIVSALFHVTLSVVLLIVTAPEEKEERL